MSKHFKICFFVLMAAAVFISHPMSAYAAESETESTESSESDSEVIAGGVVVNGIEQDLVSAQSDLPEYFYQGATSIHTQKTYGLLTHSNMVGLPYETEDGRNSYQFSVPVLFRMAVDAGHTYSGQIYFYYNADVSASNTYDGFTYEWRGFSLSGVTQQSVYDGVTVSYYGFISDVDASAPSSQMTVCITFDNYQPTFSGYLNVNFAVQMQGYFLIMSEVPEGTSFSPTIHLSSSVSSDWYGDLYDYPTAAIVDSEGTLIKEQTQLQQQIADQQAQQSAQQHEDLKTGFQDDSYNSAISGADTEIQSYIDKESQLMSDQQAQVSDFASQNFNTGVINTYMPAITMVSTWYTQIWNSFGQLNSAFVVILALGVAAFIVGLRRR